MGLSSKLGDQKTPEEIGDLLDQLGKLIDRTKVMYEQYFMGIQKMAPAQLHRDVERRIREVTQLQIRNTGLRFRFATLTQKFGSYNTYWKRTMRKIERGEYIRDVARAGRKAARRGVDMPDEVLAKIPARMRKRILRDREKMAARAAKEEARNVPAAKSSGARNTEHKVSFEDDLDLDSIFATLTSEDPKPAGAANPAADEFAERPGSYQQVGTSAKAAQQPPGRRPAPPLPQRPPTRSKPVRPEQHKQREQREQAKPARPPARAKPAPPPGMTEKEGRDLYEKYAKARRLVGDKRPVSYEQLMGKLGRQAPKIMADHNAKAVGFNVVIKGDKVVLKAKPKK